jgi:nucleoside-diphosphate-sugar epimerase
VNGDFLDTETVNKALRDVEVVFHEAALTSAPVSVVEPIRTNQYNVTGTLNLLNSCMENDVDRFILASSAAVYGDRETVPFSENDVISPKTPYAVSKAAAEYYASSYYQLHGLKTVSLRYFNVYGKRARPEQGVITIFLHKLLRDEPPIIYGDGEQKLDYINVEEVAEANMLAMSSEKALGESINVGTGRAISVNEIFHTLRDILDKRDMSPIYAEPRPGDVKIGYADVAKAKNILGFEPKMSLEEGIMKLVTWQKAKNGRILV